MTWHKHAYLLQLTLTIFEQERAMEAMVRKYQEQFLEQVELMYEETPISEATKKAFLATPRHLFASRFRQWGNKEWVEVGEGNLKEHLATLYADKALILVGEDDANVPSTISQPSFVLRMLDMLQLEPGQVVFELGAGSGWNAALMGQLVEPQGRVYSLEIIPRMARTAAATMEQLSLDHVNVIEADGGDGYVAGSPYDRAIFTAGAYDLSRHFFQQMKDDGLLLVVIKSVGGGDTLFLLRKKERYFQAIEATPCGFVPMTGKHYMAGLAPITLEALPGWSQLADKEISRQPFWWGGTGKHQFRWLTLGFRSFLGIVEPNFLAFKSVESGRRLPLGDYFGLWDKENGSLILAKHNCLITYGNVTAEKRLKQRLQQWVDFGMPTAASFDLKIYPIDVSVNPGSNEWLIKRNESQFLWGLNR